MPTDRTSANVAVASSPRMAGRAVAPLLVGCVLAVSAMTFSVLNSEAVVSNAFDRAFAALGKQPLPATTKAYDGVVGSEEFWLRAPSSANIVNAVAVGQHITLTANGTERRLTITDVSLSGNAATHIETSGNSARVLLVTCREGDARTGRDVVLRLDADRIVEVPVETVAIPRAL